MRLALFVPCFFQTSCMSCPSAMHDSKGFECLLDEKDEGKDWSCEGVDSKYTSHNTSICKLIIVKVKRKMKIILLILKNKRFHCGLIMNSAV